jgi:hypothetical protein
VVNNLVGRFSCDLVYPVSHGPWHGPLPLSPTSRSFPILPISALVISSITLWFYPVRHGPLPLFPPLPTSPSFPMLGLSASSNLLHHTIVLPVLLILSLTYVFDISVHLVHGRSCLMVFIVASLLLHF